MQTLGDFLKYLRKKKGFNQRNFADFLCVSHASYYSYEKGAGPSFDFVMKVLNMHDLTLIDLHNFCNGEENDTSTN